MCLRGRKWCHPARVIRAGALPPVQIFHDAYLLEHFLPLLVSNTSPHVWPGYRRFHAGNPALFVSLKEPILRGM
jgi:hypothetical protein